MRNLQKVYLRITMLMLLLAAGARATAWATPAAPVSLSWDASPDPSVRGYALYVGVVGETNVRRIECGLNLTGRLTDLTALVTYRIYAVSYNAQGVESRPSNEVIFTPPRPAGTIPEIPRLQIARLADGAMQLSHSGLTNGAYALQFAPNLVATQWQTLANFTVSTGGFVIADLTARVVPQRFYRLATGPQPLITALAITNVASGGVRITALTPPVAQVQVQKLLQIGGTNWTPVVTLFTDATGRIEYTDPAAGGSGIYRVVVLPGPAEPRLTIALLSDRRVKVSSVVPTGTTVRIQAASQLGGAAWTTLATLTAGTSGLVEYTDAAAAQLPVRFYRLVLP